MAGFGSDGLGWHGDSRRQLWQGAMGIGGRVWNSTAGRFSWRDGHLRRIFPALVVVVVGLWILAAGYDGLGGFVLGVGVLSAFATVARVPGAYASGYIAGHRLGWADGVANAGKSAVDDGCCPVCGYHVCDRIPCGS